MIYFMKPLPVHRAWLQPADRALRDAGAGLRLAASRQSPYPAVQSAGADLSDRCFRDLGPGLSGRRVQLAGGGHAAGRLLHPGPGIFLPAAEALIILKLSS